MGGQGGGIEEREIERQRNNKPSLQNIRKTRCMCVGGRGGGEGTNSSWSANRDGADGCHVWNWMSDQACPAGPPKINRINFLKPFFYSSKMSI